MAAAFSRGLKIIPIIKITNAMIVMPVQPI